MAHTAIDANTHISHTKDVIARNIEGEVVLLSLDTGVYYSLDEVGARVWQLMENGGTVASVMDSIVEEYDVDQQTAEADLLELLRDLAAEHLIVVVNK